MASKNVNEGTIKSDGGSVQIGDNNVTNIIINGLETLLQDYKIQIRQIEEYINSLKADTALSLIKDLEIRIDSSEVSLTPKIKSKISYLKATCKRALGGYSVEETSREFISAYKTNEESLKETACVEYYNLKEYEISEKLADELISLDEFNNTAWTIKMFVSNNLIEDLKDVPKTVSSKKGFRLNLIYHLIKNHRTEEVKVLFKNDLTIEFDKNDFNDLTERNKMFWILSIDFLLNKIFSNIPIKQISVDNELSKNTSDIDNAIYLLDKFIKEIEKTELGDTITHQKFFFYYLKFFQTKHEEYYRELEKLYEKVKTDEWFYTLSFSQALLIKNINPISIIEDYETYTGNFIPELSIFKAIALRTRGQFRKIPKVLDEYLDAVGLIDERTIFSIQNYFLGVFRYDLNDEETLSDAIQKTLNKKFKNESIKQLFYWRGIVLLNNNESIDNELENLINLTKSKELDYDCKNLLASTLGGIGETQRAIDFLNTYIDKSIVNEGLRLYILLLNDLITSNKESGRGIYKELLYLLEFFRLNTELPDEFLLNIEHNLNSLKNDWGKLEIINEELHKSFPKKLTYLANYLAILEKNNEIDKLLSFSDSIPENYEDETTGLIIASIFLRTTNKNKGAKILYNLASKPFNKKSRLTYFTSSLNFEKEFFKQFDVAEVGMWVRYVIGDTTKTIELTNESTGIDKKILGKKVGEKFSFEHPLTSKVFNVEIILLFNNELKLFYDIMDEANDPSNEIGIYSMKLPEKVEDLSEYLINTFGVRGSQQKDYVDNFLIDYYNYKVGFSEVSRNIFEDNFIDTYHFLTNSKKSNFNTIPKKLSYDIKLEHNFDFALDSSSLLLFYYLDKELNFNFNNKFIIAYSLRENIDLIIDKEKNSVPSQMKLNITMEGIDKYLTPVDYRNKIIDFFTDLLKWIDEKCIVDLVEEKLDLLAGLDNKELSLDEQIMKSLIDNMHLTYRQQVKLISNDSTFYIFQRGKSGKNDIISPEVFLNTYYPTKSKANLYRYFLKNNYVGISISKNVLKSEFFDYLSGLENYYQNCLTNVQFSIHNDFNQINEVILFLKDVYLMASLNLDSKNRYTSEIIKYSLYGLPKNQYRYYRNTIEREFLLLGNYYTDILSVFDSVVKIYG